jgi:hypothetical protein
MLTCPTCQAENQDGARFCNNCGSPLGTPRPVQGERKFATVLFADVVEDGALRAVRAALGIQQDAAAYARTVASLYGVDFGVRIRINTGTAVLATVGDEVKAECTPIGDAANVAARLRSAVKHADVHLMAGVMYREMGDVNRALEHARIGAEKAESADAIDCACSGYLELGLARSGRSELSDALAVLDIPSTSPTSPSGWAPAWRASSTASTEAWRWRLSSRAKKSVP